MSSSFKRNHYVPKWYQKKFLIEDKFYYLDLKPDKIPNTNKFRKDLLRWGPQKCFVQEDLYTTKFGKFENVDIEKYFFGTIDRLGKQAVEYFTKFNHADASQPDLINFLVYLSIQKLRTPKGLGWLSQKIKLEDKNLLLRYMQHFQSLNCAIWTEAVWQIADADKSETKFIISDHPVTVYNRACFPMSKWCKGYNDPEIYQVATHTFFPLNLNKVLILTNLSWVRNPYQNELKLRPNPSLFRNALFNFWRIQIHRSLNEQEVREINYITKTRALRYIAAAKEEWLFPEKYLRSTFWKKFGKGYLLMPDPRSFSMGGEVIIGYKDGSSDGFSEYGHKPWQKDYKNQKRFDTESKSLYRFQGEFAKKFGRKRRGRTHEFSRLEQEEDSEDYHNYHLSFYEGD